MFRIIRVPPTLENFFHTLQPHFHWDHFAYFRLLVLVIAFAWGRRTVSSLYRYLDAKPHRTRFNNFFLVQRWDPEAALRQKARELLVALHPTTGETLYLILDDSKKAKRGKAMDAVAKMKDPTIDAYIRGHQYVCAVLVCRDHVIPWGIRLYLKPEHARALALPFHKTTELAAQLIREFNAAAGVSVVVLFDAYYLCRTVEFPPLKPPLPCALVFAENKHYELVLHNEEEGVLNRKAGELAIFGTEPTNQQGTVSYKGVMQMVNLKESAPIHVTLTESGVVLQFDDDGPDCTNLEGPRRERCLARKNKLETQKITGECTGQEWVRLRMPINRSTVNFPSGTQWRLRPLQ